MSPSFGDGIGSPGRNPYVAPCGCKVRLTPTVVVTRRSIPDHYVRHVEIVFNPRCQTVNGHIDDLLGFFVTERKRRQRHHDPNRDCVVIPHQGTVT